MMRGIEPITEQDRRGLGINGRTQLDRIEHKVDSLLRHFGLPTELADVLTESADDLGAPDPTDADAAPSAPKRPRRGRRAA